MAEQMGYVCKRYMQDSISKLGLVDTEKMRDSVRSWVTDAEQRARARKKILERGYSQKRGMTATKEGRDLVVKDGVLA